MWSSLLRDERGNVSIIVAVTLLIFCGLAGFALDYGRFFLIQGREQLAADAAATAAAFAYGSSSNSSTAATEGCVVASLNGIPVTCTGTIPTSIVKTTIEASPTVAGAQAAHVVIHSNLKYSGFGALLARGTTSLPVSAQAWASIPTPGPGCFIALNAAAAATAIDLEGSASINASLCVVEAGGAIALNGNTSLTASSVLASGKINVTGSSKVTAQQQQNFSFGASGAKPADPLAATSTITAALSRVTTVAAYSSGMLNNLLGTLLSGVLSYTPTCVANKGTVAAGIYVNLVFSNANCTYTVTGPISVTGNMVFSAKNITVNFNGAYTQTINKLQAGSTGDLINASGSIFNILGGVSTTAVPSDLSIGCTALFSAGGCTASDPDFNTYNILGGVKTNDGTLVFGNGNFTISGGVSIANGAACSAGNTLQFGSGTNFSVVDTGISLVGGCFITGSDTNHDINSGSANGNGIVNSYGSTVVTLGSGAYTVNGNISLNGASSSSGSGISLTTSGNVTIGASALVNWSAPSSSPYLISTTSSSSSAVLISGGTSGTVLNGMIYAPNGGVVLNGSGAINASAPSGFCFSLIASTIQLTGGTVAAAVCPGAGNAGGTVALIQ